MRRSSHENGFVFADDGTLEGVALGFDFAAEHEMGIRQIKQQFGIGEAADKGLDSRRVTLIPECLSFYKSRDGNEALLSFDAFGEDLSGRPSKASTLRNHSELRFYDTKFRDPRPEDDFVAAWGEKDFGIHVRGSKNVNALKTIHEGFKQKTIVVGLKPAESWLGTGLLFVLESAFTDEAKAEVLEADESHEMLLKAVEASGIKDTLRKAGCSYFALSPRWTEGRESEIRFWLNPMQQRENNYGWYLLADLEAWAVGTGPIPKKSGA